MRDHTGDRIRRLIQMDGRSARTRFATAVGRASAVGVRQASPYDHLLERNESCLTLHEGILP